MAEHDCVLIFAATIAISSGCRPEGGKTSNSYPTSPSSHPSSALLPSAGSASSLPSSPSSSCLVALSLASLDGTVLACWA